MKLEGLAAETLEKIEERLYKTLIRVLQEVRTKDERGGPQPPPSRRRRVAPPARRSPNRREDGYGGQSHRPPEPPPAAALPTARAYFEHARMGAPARRFVGASLTTTAMD